MKTQKKGSIITANIEIELDKNLQLKEATKISEDLRKKLTSEISELDYVAIQIESHEVATGFYRAGILGEQVWQRKGRFRSESRAKEGATGGPGGYCVCKECGYKVLHQPGVPCFSIICPKCKSKLERE